MNRCWRRPCGLSCNARGQALQVLATAGDGGTAVQQALTLQPDVLFF